MKPLLSKDLTIFLERFVNFEDAEFRKADIIDPTTIRLTFATQDKNRGYDWISVSIEFSGVNSATLVDDNQLPFVDMGNGITLENDGTHFAFKIVNSTCQIQSSSVKYEEGQF